MSLDRLQEASRSQFDRQSDRYGRTHVLADTADLDSATEGLIVEAEPGDRAVDVACGGGHAALWLAERGYQVVATDLSPRMLENTKALLASEGFDCATIECPAEVLAVDSAVARVVTCRVAAHHFSSPADFLAECSRVLLPGGKLVLIDGTVPDGNEVAAGWMHAVEKLRDPSHGRLVPPGEWRELCSGAGLDVVRCGVSRLKQPDLEWYFQTAATSPENRLEVQKLVEAAPPEVIEAFGLDREDGKVVWWWPRLHLVAEKK